ncbi:MAG: type II toxin-antitoxin system HipA family toxin [Lachnospiraceae bacterium]|nr:type II toxin-antitoxin system HipA family toxin [Lachnospiraceae bacterium]
MIENVEVKMWGTTIGYLHLDGKKPYAAFEYDRDFLQSGIELAPIYMPLSNRVFEFPNLTGDAFHGVPGMIADSLPDKFGNAVINKWLSSRGMTEQDFNVLDRLCYTGSRGMGALEYYPANGPDIPEDESVNVKEMVRFASDILQSRTDVELKWEDNLTKAQLLQLGTSAGGARAKAIIAWNPETGDVRSGQANLKEGYDFWIIKFDGVSRNGDHGLEDQPQYTKIEYAYYKMACLAGINMNECRLLEENGNYHFMTKRFDRVEGKKLHMQTLGAVGHIDYNIPGLCSYEQAVVYMKKMGLLKSEIEQFYRRMVFNVLAVNQDDHVKNVSFLMDKSGTWKLSPAYDITFSYDKTNRWLSAHQMLINEKNEHILREDLLAAGKHMGISAVASKNIIAQVQEAIAEWMSLADQVGIRENTATAIQQMLRESEV